MGYLLLIGEICPTSPTLNGTPGYAPVYNGNRSFSLLLSLSYTQPRTFPTTLHTQTQWKNGTWWNLLFGHFQTRSRHTITYITLLEPSFNKHVINKYNNGKWHKVVSCFLHAGYPWKPMPLCKLIRFKATSIIKFVYTRVRHTQPNALWYGIKLQKSALRKAFRWASNVYGWEWYRNVAGDLLN